MTKNHYMLYKVCLEGGKEAGSLIWVGRADLKVKGRLQCGVRSVSSLLSMGRDRKEGWNIALSLSGGKY